MSPDFPTTDDLFCPNCDYNLTGLTENRCPECGLPFDPTEVLVLQLARPKPLGRSGLVLLAAWPLAAGPLMSLSAVLSQQWLFGTWLICIGIAALLTSLSTAERLLATIRPRLNQRRVRFFVIWLAGLAMAMFLVQVAMAIVASYFGILLAYSRGST